jgi:hypothetical protein
MKSQKTGDAMFIATVHIFNESGCYRSSPHTLWEKATAEWQLRSPAEAFNVLESYKMDSINAHDLEGKSAFAKVGIEEDESGVEERRRMSSAISQTSHRKLLAQPNRPSASPLRLAKIFANQDIPF